MRYLSLLVILCCTLAFACKKEAREPILHYGYTGLKTITVYNIDPYTGQRWATPWKLYYEGEKLVRITTDTLQPQLGTITYSYDAAGRCISANRLAISNTGDTFIRYGCELNYEMGNLSEVVIHDMTRTGDDIYNFRYSVGKMQQVFYHAFSNGVKFGDTTVPLFTVANNGGNIALIKGSNRFSNTRQFLYSSGGQLNNLGAHQVWLFFFLLDRHFYVNELPIYMNNNVVTKVVDSLDGSKMDEYTCEHIFNSSGQITSRVRTRWYQTIPYDSVTFGY